MARKYRVLSPEKKAAEAAQPKSLAQQLILLNLRIIEIEGDGNCLFRALGDQLDGTDVEHVRHRKEVVTFITQNKDDFAPFVEDDVPFEKHVSEMRLPGTYAGNDAIVAFSRLHDCVVVIHQCTLPAWEVRPQNFSEHLKQPRLHLSYHDNQHYNSVRHAADFSTNPGYLRISIEVAKSSTESTPAGSPKLSSASTTSSLEPSEASRNRKERKLAKSEARAIERRADVAQAVLQPAPSASTTKLEMLTI